MIETSLRLGFFVATFAAMAVWEVALPRRQLIRPRSARWPANLGLAVLNSAMLRVVAAGALISAAAFAAERGVGILHWISPPVWARWIVTILALDFAVYLQHVMFHAVPVFWRLHRVHHADLGFDVSTGVRFHPLEILISTGLKLAVVVPVGAAPWAVVAFEILLNASSLFNHGNVAMPERLDRWLRWFVVTPDMHRIHHSSRVVETNSNFGFSFSWWDRLGGTYRREPALGQLGLEIGLTEYRKSLHLGELLLLPFRGGAGSYTFAGSNPAAELGISADDLRERLSTADPPVVLDVRTPPELDGPLGRIEGAVNIPVDELPNRMEVISAWRTRLLVPV
jgi:sterol desaturase/sphingolipid hydroxylase (fatty acid hydroxylase superfamily)